MVMHREARAKGRAKIQEILDGIGISPDLYPEGTTFRLLDKGEGFLLQLVYPEADIYSGHVEQQNARKWYISPFATETEIVESAYTAVLRSLRHRLGEAFTYQGRRVYSPHLSIVDRWRMADHHNLDYRGK